ncbi:MAG TPA: signal peptide peptidase SppA [Thermoanaerobaculia bacterium]|jgi:protease-4|nr:signal peptide peptidase SppA [Thermoanaerobaculia bacterium]
MSELEPVTVPADPIADPIGSPVAEHRPRKSRAGMFFFGAFSGCLIVVVGMLFLGFLIAAMANNDSTTRGDVFGDKVAIIPIDGEILGSRDVIDALHRYARNSNVKAIVVRINSPGGAIAPSQEIYEEIRNVRARSGKPIIASLDSVAASGGYYIAAACDSIVANPGSITGSIGVILQWMEMKDLLAWAKLKPETITSGAMKAAGSPYQDLTADQRAYFQTIVTQLKEQFVRAVAVGRKGKMTEADVSRIADGRVFTGEQALELKLVDQLGNLDDAIRIAAKRGGIAGKPGTIYPKKRTRGLFDALTSDDSDTETAISRILTRRPRFLFQW